VARLNAPSGKVRLARGLNAPSGEVRFARGLSAPSGEVCLAQGPPRTRRPRSCSHIRAFNALTLQDFATIPTRLGITPRRCSTHSLGKTIAATIQHCAERPVSAPWHCAAYFCTANTSSPRRGDDGTLEWGRTLFYDYTGPHRDDRPAGTVFPVTVSPVRPSPLLQHHAGYCDDIPNAVEAHEDRTSPRPPLYLVRTPINATLESAHGRRLGSQPLHHHPRSRSWRRT
jgi:hypothetical protein